MCYDPWFGRMMFLCSFELAILHNIYKVLTLIYVNILQRNGGVFYHNTIVYQMGNNKNWNRLGIFAFYKITLTESSDIHLFMNFMYFKT